MIGTITYTRRPLWLRALKPVRVWMLEREVESAEQYLRNTESGGVFSPAQIDELRANITPLRVALIWWRNA